MKLLFARHGESEANCLRVISNRGWQHGLTETGRAQAARLAAHLAGQGIGQIYSSPLQRAVETAAVVAESLKLPLTITDALREYDCGEAEGRADGAAWALWEEVRADWFERGLRDARIPGGESFNDIRARFLPFVYALRGKAPILLIGHGGTYTAMLPQLCANLSDTDLRQLSFPNTAYALVEEHDQIFDFKAMRTTA